MLAEWNNKAASVVSYGVEGGIPAAKQLRLVMGELKIADVRQAVALTLADDFDNFTTVTPRRSRSSEPTAMLDELGEWGTALVRSASRDSDRKTIRSRRKCPIASRVSCMDDTKLWTGESVPIQGLGLMRLTEDGWGDEDRDPGLLVRAAVDAGVTLLDTAEMYGNEELVGRAVAAHRDQVTLCSKFGVYWGPSGRFDDWTVRADPATVRAAIEGTLRRLNVDTVDLYYLHHRSEQTPIEDTIGAMADLRRAGKIRALGLSNVTVDDVRRAHAVHPIAAVQQEWSVAQRAVEAMMPVLAELKIVLVAHSPLGHGTFMQPPQGAVAHVLARIAPRYGATPSQMALAWVHNRGHQSGQTVIPLPGTTRVTHLVSNIAAARLTINDTDLDDLDAVMPLTQASQDA